jgi:hypothetical protein
MSTRGAVLPVDGVVLIATWDPWRFSSIRGAWAQYVGIENNLFTLSHNRRHGGRRDAQRAGSRSA